MTRLTKKVTRIVRLALDHRPGDTAPEVAVTLYPCGDIGFRKVGTQTEYRYPLAAVYTRAVQADAEAKRKEKAKQKMTARK